MKIYDYIVIGSGPSGVSCSKAIVEKKNKVLMIDVGKKIETNIINEFNTIFKNNPIEKARKSIINLCKKKINFTKKKYFTSEFCYEDFNEFVVGKKKKNIFFSNARGGFSNVWGGACLPYRNLDIQDWPINSESLNLAYKKIQEEIDISFEKDELINLYPTYNDNKINNKIKRSDDEKELYSCFKKQNVKNMFVGFSRLASKNNCPLCLFGCPEKHIYNSSQTLEKLIKNENFNYLKNHKLEKFIEKEEYIELKILNILDKKISSIYCKKLFLGAGPLSTFNIVINSLKPKKTFVLKENQIFALPIYSFKKTYNKYNQISLSSFFVEVLDDINPKKNIHLQLYILNEYLLGQIKSLIIFKFFPRIILKFFLRRFVFALGYLNSAFSNSMEIKPVYKNNKIFYDVRNINNILLKKQVKNISTKFKSNKNFIFLNNFIKLFDFGSGNHFGCLFPMKKNPKYLETFDNGKLNGTRNIFIIDSSNFTSIPPNTITYSIMANAYRIGKLNS